MRSKERLTQKKRVVGCYVKARNEFSCTDADSEYIQKVDRSVDRRWAMLIAEAQFI